MVRRLDEALGRLVDALNSLDLAHNTVLLYTSDHGCHFKTRNAEYKRSCHDASIRVPTLLWGGPFMGGGQVQHLTTSLDLPPTLLGAAGLEVPDSLPGRSVRPLLGGTSAPWLDEVYVQISGSELGRALRTKRFKYGVTAPGADPVADAFAGRYTETHLYDLQADPYELTNLAGVESYRKVSDELHERLLESLKEAGAPPAIIEPAPSRGKGQRHPDLAAAREDYLT